MDTVQIVFDIGGTKTRVASVSGGELGASERFPSSKNPGEGIVLLMEAAKRLAGSSHISSVVGDISGIVAEGIALTIPHLPEWNGTPLAERLSGALDSAPVTLFNDVELVGLGEYYFGAGKGEEDMLYVTVSTGVGGAHIKSGVSVHGTYNMEVGHHIIDGKQELEELVSGTAVEKKYGVSPKDFDSAEALEELADILAVGLYNTTLHLSPEVIVLGGSMIVGENAIPLARVEKTFQSIVKKYYPSAPRIIKAALDSDGGLWGGVGYLRRINAS